MLIPKRTSGGTTSSTPSSQARVGTVISVDPVGITATVNYIRGGTGVALPVYAPSLPQVGAQVLCENLDDNTQAVTGILIPPFSPAAIPNMLAWFDASDATSLTMSGSSVMQWGDRSGTGNNATQFLGVGSPVLVPNAVNGLPALQFGVGGVQTGFQIANVATSPNWTMISVVVPPSVDNHNVVMEAANDHGNFQLTTSKVIFFGGSALEVTGVVAGPNLVTLINGSPSTGQVNGGALVTGNTGYNTPQGPWSLGLAMIQTPQTQALHFDGQICEYLLFNRSLSSVEVANVQLYLRTKWGLSF